MKKVIMGLTAVVALLGSGANLFCLTIFWRAPRDRDALKLLQEIHDEVVLLGKYPGQDFFKREFFVGEDDDDTNKDIHVAIVIHDAGTEEKMTIQVTYMERTKSRPVVGVARSTKTIKCSCRENDIDIRHSEYSEKELKSILKDILRAIQDKKRLLKKTTPC